MVISGFDHHILPPQQLCLLLWGTWKTTYGNNPHTANKLSEEISSAIIITADTLSRVVTSFQHQLQIAMDVDGSHIENSVEQSTSWETIVKVQQTDFIIFN
jgi:hypothetical protein